jgi:hypothetical protein
MTLYQAVTHFGSTAALAAALELKERTVEKWTVLDLRTQLAIQALSSGKLKADKK